MNSNKTRKVSLRTVSQAFAERVPFDCNGTLTADYARYPEAGRLNADESKILDAYSFLARTEGVPLYVVKSYATPIAWSYTTTDGTEYAYKVKQKFSVTTSRHQGKV